RLDEYSGHALVTFFARLGLCQRIVLMRVESGGDEQHRRLELIEAREDFLLHRGEVIIIISAGPEGDVDDETFTRPDSRFPFVAAAGVAGARMLVQADEELARIVLKAGLRAVAVVDVEIDDPDPLDRVFLLKITCGDGDVGEEAETHGALGFGMMAGRARG